ncbi:MULTISPECIES: Lrp/AsnC family transcriptional regulator [unclassified Fusibacter]|uniref:Lrp/AsnC family transcriptional regulator n=1 Tax=unclassified Fusibacter TaxID=2624464 RepID=UPI001010426F|nr:MULTISPECIES: Lrp/AsnC family transcriptional regulator [unclassified Fusibacter]MCK8058452.1 Lrp/AsnC family transcriptional regulator [Fusibacter sp. A2]NPE22780.1 Lrp/AsnC family transcriptional regulator [Fusibacter sp. A1]RXV60336.1 Lrp/AsnC family transcriptional regulator [Fusibacter sp. A1]
MDIIDLKIIACLQDDARISVTDISKKINLSRPSVSERLYRLNEDKVITAYKALLDPQFLGYPITFYMNISEIVGSVDTVVHLLESTPFVTEIHCMTGNINYLVKAHASSVQAMHDFLAKLIRYCKVESSIVLNSPLPARSLPPSNTFKTSEK